MRKLLFIGILFVGILVAFMNIKEEQKEIRVRVIPNSDQAYDLKVKEQAKELTTLYLKEAYHVEYTTYENNIRNTMNQFEQVLKKRVKTACGS